MSIARLTVSRFNKRVLRATRMQIFECEKMDNVVDVTGGGSSFSYRTENSIPALYHVSQTTAQIRAICTHCCDSNSD